MEKILFLTWYIMKIVVFFNMKKTSQQLAQNICFKKQGSITFQKYQWHGTRT